MNIGFSAISFPGKTFDQLIDFGSKHGFSSIEMVCSPKGTVGFHHLDAEDLDDEKAAAVRKKLEDKGIAISCLSYYANLLVPIDGSSQYHAEYLKLLIDTAHKMGVDKISTFTGFLYDRSPQDNLEELARMMRPLLSYAASKKVRIMLENTPLITGQPFGGNFAYSPETWDMIFTRIPNENLGLNYDPSHLFWLGADYLLFLGVFSERIFHVQAKDAEILIEKLRMKGIFGDGWFRYRIPGTGSIDWRKFVSTLFDAGYDGVLSIENEDPLWLETPEKAERGLLFGKKYLEALII